MNQLINELEKLDYKTKGSSFAKEQAASQLNAILDACKKQYPNNILLKSLESLSYSPLNEKYQDLLERIKSALGSEALDSNEVLLSQKFKILRAEEQLRIDFDHFKDNNLPLSLIFFDIDNFKSLNSKHTENLVDRDILIPLQEFILELIEYRGNAYAFGGDEFYILLNNAEQIESEAFCQRLVTSIRNIAFCTGDQITISAGSATFPNDTSDFDELKIFANQAENHIKKTGKDNSCSYASLPK